MKPDSSRDREETDHQQLAVIVRGRDDTIGRTLFSSSPFPKHLQSPTRKLDPDGKLAIDFLSRRTLLGFRWFSMKCSELGAKMSGVLGRNGMKILVGALKNTISRYKEAVGLPIEYSGRGIL
nr:uncharacterized protein LOC109186905 [Ipomoea trifida]